MFGQGKSTTNYETHSQQNIVTSGDGVLMSYTVITRTIGFRVPRDEELTGLDTTYHAESAYDITGNSNRY